MKLTQQEAEVLSFLCSKQEKEVYWEELVQFCKNPTSVKLKTIQKIVSDLKKKYKDSNQAIPFNCTFKVMQPQIQSPKMISTNETTQYLGQTLVQIKRPGAMVAPKISPIVEQKPTVIETKTIHSEFVLKSFNKQIVTRSGIYSLNHEEFEIFDYLYNNRSKFISLEELRDKVCFPKYGSKLPARWFSAIQRRVSHIRHQIPETRNRLLTAKQGSSGGYIFN
jgi:DNA-binding winged helix-turn-helix (wHTH) protein